jgi:hypothetical protein
MSASTRPTWQESNQLRLARALSEVRALLEAPAGPERAPRRLPHETAEEGPGDAALDTLVTTFGLSPFERSVLLLCAGVELDAGFAAAVARAQAASAAPPSFALALSLLPDAHWSALSPEAPLRRWRLVELDGPSPTLSALRIDERVLHFLTGTSYLDARLAALVEPAGAAHPLVPSHEALADRLLATLSHASPPLPLVELRADEPTSAIAIAARVCRGLGLHLHTLPAPLLPTDPAEVRALSRLWEREAALASSALLVDRHDLDASDRPRAAALDRLLETTGGVFFIGARERRTLARATLSYEVHPASRQEQRQVWQSGLGAAAGRLTGVVDALVSQFSLSAPAITATCSEALAASSGPEDLAGTLWRSCRARTRPGLDGLAQRLDPAASWHDLVLPRAQRQLLRELAVHVRQRATVYETWRFADKGARGLGISALFAGPSGTGKTMAAEVLAGDLDLDLYRIDLSQVVSKYIGETEKNLGRLFDAAEAGGAILLFDEADALFGKRSEVKDSHDRYANIEVSYLLQRMETYRGLAILTTNLKESLDTAFLRRIRFVVHFPFPDAPQRAEIWRRTFPAETPTDALRPDELARLDITGGHIRNIALYASFLAAEAGDPVTMQHLLRAAQVEYGKLERPLTEAETGGWL